MTGAQRRAAGPVSGIVPGVFTKEFESSDQTITAAGALTVAHGLGVQPKLYRSYLKCVIASEGYSIDDEVEVESYLEGSGGTAASRGISVVPDGTNLNVRFGSSVDVFIVLNKSSGGRDDTDLPNWKLVLRAWA